MTTDTPPVKATRREWIGLAILALPCIVYAMDLTVLNFAVPAISRDLAPTAAELLWIIDIYGFFVAGFLITMGTLGDRLGGRRMLMIGAVAFIGASVLAAFAPTAELLIAARALLGVAGATLGPSTLSIIRNMFHDEHERLRAIGIWVACFSAGGAVGPIIGGIMLEYFWWGSVFLLAVPVMALLLIVGPRLLPEFRNPESQKLDPLSAILSMGAVLAIIFALKDVAQDGFGWRPALALIIGVALGTVFAQRQLRLADPLIDVRLFARPAFSGALAINVISIFTAFGFFLFMSQYLQLVLGLPPLIAGLWSAPSGVIFAVGSVMTPIIVGRLGRFAALACGFGVSAVGFAIIAQSASLGLPAFVIGQVVFCSGFAPLGAVTTDLVMSAAPPEKAGAAAAISETSFELGGALGIACLGSLSVAIYRSVMSVAPPDGVPANSWEAARHTLGGAAAAAESLPAPAASAVMAIARDAFMRGFTLTSLLCAAALTALAIAIMAARRRLAPAQPGV